MAFIIKETNGDRELHLTVSVKDHPFFMGEFAPGWGELVKSNTGCLFTVVEITDSTVTVAVGLFGYNAPEMLRSTKLNMFKIKSFVNSITSFSTPTKNEVDEWKKRDLYCQYALIASDN